VKKSVVIVDDSYHATKQLAAFFDEKLEFTIAGTGADGYEAVNLYKKHKPDLLTLDITMPNMNGVDAVREIMGQFSDAKIIMITAVRGQEASKCLKLGAKEIIFKPLKLSSPEYIKEFRTKVEMVVSS
jgi:two-component system chemotaxis response regulator CheY